MNTIEFDKKVICNDEYVAVRIIDNSEELKLGGIWLTGKANSNERMALARIEAVGKTAKEEYGLEVGDYVYFDRLSTYGHTAPVALTKYNNILFKTNEKADEYFPLRNMVFVEPIETNDVSNVGGFYVQHYAEKMKTGKITKMNCDVEVPYKEGDTVILSTGADNITLGKYNFRIYKHDMIVATIGE